MIVYYTEFDNIFDSYITTLRKERAENSPSFSLGSSKVKNSGVLRCPAQVKSLDSYYVVKSPYNFKLCWDGENFTTPDYDQNFWDLNLYQRDGCNGLVSFAPPKLMFVAEKNLEMELLPAFWHKNDLTQKTTMIGGKFDIGRHTRKIESALIFHEPCEVDIKKNDALYYLRFGAGEKIMLKPFQFVEDIKSLVSGVLCTMQYNKGKPETLDYWYLKNKLFYRKRLLNLIKQNLMV